MEQMMFLVFKSVNEPLLGIIKRYGQYLDYVVGYLDDAVKDIVPIAHLNPTIIDDPKVAAAWKFTANYSGYISVRPNTLMNEQLELMDSTEPDSMKAKYYLTDEDKANTVTFMKIVLRKILDEVYDRRMQQLHLGVSDLEFATWPAQLTEAQAYAADATASVPMLTSLAQARNITVEAMSQLVLAANAQYNQNVADLLAKKQMIEKEIKSCQAITELNVVIHNRFGYNMPTNQQVDMGIEYSSKYDL